jgi:NADH-quinone oxidoreductase subunit H
MQDLIESINTFGASFLGDAWPVAWILIKIIAVVLPILGCVAYLTLWNEN